MKIYDCFSYWDEDLLLDLRLNILNNYVDYFVIVEGNKTWQNNPKKLRFEIDKFKKLRSREIIFIEKKYMKKYNKIDIIYSNKIFKLFFHIVKIIKKLKITKSSWIIIN